MRLMLISHIPKLLLFQFTHPGRGATQLQSPRSTSLNRFNSRTPGGVRHDVIYHQSIIIPFQFTHPGRGATAKRAGVLLPAQVSIHAPREGCDPRRAWASRVLTSFNSRTPGGVRPPLPPMAEQRLNSFNSRTPGGVRHADSYLCHSCSSFNSRTPGGVRLY